MSDEGLLVGYLKKACVFVVVIGVFVQARLYHFGIHPTAVSMMGGNPELPSLPPDSRLSGIVEKIGEGDLLGPESLVTSNHEGKDYLFAALGDGRIVRIDASDPSSLTWDDVIRTGSDDPNCGKGGPADHTDTELICGRPLGLALVKRSTVDPNFNSNFTNEQKGEDVLIVLDLFGLLMIDSIYSRKPNKHVIATHAKGDDKPFHLLNAVVQAADGSLYLTETSTDHYRRRIFHAAFDGRPKGRLLRYTKQNGVQVLKDDIYMPNGITLAHDQKSLIIVSSLQLLKYTIDTDHLELFVHVMPGSGDNIKTYTHLPTGQTKKCYWAGLGSKCVKPFCFLQAMLDRPKLRAFVISLVPYNTIVNAVPKFSGFAVYDTHGELIETYQDPNVVAPWLSEAEPVGDYIYLGSWFNPFLARVKKEDLIVASSSLNQ